MDVIAYFVTYLGMDPEFGTAVWLMEAALCVAILGSAYFVFNMPLDLFIIPVYALMSLGIRLVVTIISVKVLHYELALI